MRQARASTRKWFGRAIAFLEMRKKFSSNVAVEYQQRFKRQDKFAAAVLAIRAATAVVAR